MDKKLKYQILKIIQHNGNILDIITKGYEFGQVASFISKLQDLRYIKFDANNKLVLSDIGEAFLKCYEIDHNIKKYSNWILPQDEMWVKPLNKFDIYIPNK